ncbi:MAG: replication initiator protein [Arizlama microvirus]|nr:MAG: replication initiator protein [Arizlama microvirus]
MPCFHPAKAFLLSSGGLSFTERGDIVRDLKIPCGQCMGCRIDKARDWSLRITHESKLHQANWFATLTYDNENLPNPPSLNYSHFQQWAKNVRKKLGPFRFFMCGEYGEQTHRPHFHAILFGLEVKDVKRWGGSDKMPTWTSDALTSSWGKGMIVLGQVTQQSAQYVARYNLKKVTGDLAEIHYRWIDPEIGEEHQLEPEFCQMSRRPGIGAAWYNRYHTDFHTHDYAISDGAKNPVPKYYDKLAKKHGHELDVLKMARETRALPKAWNNTPERLATRETVLKSKLNLKRRAL